MRENVTAQLSQCYVKFAEALKEKCTWLWILFLLLLPPPPSCRHTHVAGCHAPGDLYLLQEDSRRFRSRGRRGQASMSGLVGWTRSYCSNYCPHCPHPPTTSPYEAGALYLTKWPPPLAHSWITKRPQGPAANTPE